MCEFTKGCFHLTKAGFQLTKVKNEFKIVLSFEDKEHRILYEIHFILLKSGFLFSKKAFLPSLASSVM